MGFRGDCITDLDTVIFTAEEGAVTATYNTTSVLIYPLSRIPTLQNPEASGETLDVLLRVSDVANPVTGDIMEIDGTAWHIRSLTGGAESGLYRLTLTRSTRRRLL